MKKQFKNNLLIMAVHLIFFICSQNGFSMRRIGLMIDTGYQGCILNGYPPYSSGSNNFNPSVAEKAMSISRIGVFFLGEYTHIGVSFLFGQTNIDRKDWSIDTRDNGDGTYTIRDYYSIYDKKKSVFGAEFELKFFLVKLIGLKRFAPYFIINLGCFFEQNKKTGEVEIGTRTDYNFGEYTSHIEDYNNWYDKKRVGYTRKNFAYYGGLGIGANFFIFHNFGFDVRIIAIFDNFDAAIMLRGSVGVFFLFN